MVAWYGGKLVFGFSFSYTLFYSPFVFHYLYLARQTLIIDRLAFCWPLILWLSTIHCGEAIGEKGLYSVVFQPISHSQSPHVSGTGNLGITVGPIGRLGNPRVYVGTFFSELFD